MKITFAAYKFHNVTVEVHEIYMSTDTALVSYRMSPDTRFEVSLDSLSNVQTYDRADVADPAGYDRVVVLPRYSLDQLLDVLQKAAATNDDNRNDERIQRIRDEIKNRMD